MVKPLNKEWELFGRKYRVPGAKGDKVDCNACHKQCSAAVNRLQSHLRVCPARPQLPMSLSLVPQDPHGGDMDTHGAMGDGALHDPSDDAIEDTADLTDSAAALDQEHSPADAAARVVGASSATPATDAASAVAGTASATVTGVKRQRTSPSSNRQRDRQRWNPVMMAAAHNNSIAGMEDFWFSPGGATTPQTQSSTTYAKKRVEIEEKRLLLETKKDLREERREMYNLEILEAQARKEKILAEKECYEARVLLALSRKQLRDQGVSEAEIDRILPVEGAVTSQKA